MDKNEIDAVLDKTQELVSEWATTFQYWFTEAERYVGEAHRLAENGLEVIGTIVDEYVGGSNVEEPEDDLRERVAKWYEKHRPDVRLIGLSDVRDVDAFTDEAIEFLAKYLNIT